MPQPSPATTAPTARAPGAGQGLVFVLLAGALAEAFELLQLQAGGIAPPGIALRLSLWVGYALLAAAVFAGARLVVPRRALPVAAVGFAAAVLLPWLNFAYLPRVTSALSILGTLAALAVLAAVVPLLFRLPRAMVGVAAAAVVALNAWGLAAAGGSSGTLKAARSDLPFNVLVVLIDTLRADHLGAYGYARPTSPRFDALARDSVLFERTVAQAPWTKPSIASLFTGRYVKHHGVISSRDALGDELPTLAEQLGERGYRTVAFSGNPWITPEFRFDRGFDQFESGRAMGAQLTSLYKLLKRVDRVLGQWSGGRVDMAGTVFWGTSGNIGNSERDRLLTDAVVEWIGTHGADPFFMYLHLIGPHDPYNPPLEYVRPFREADWDGTPGPTKPPARVQTIFEHAEPLDAQEQAALIAQYDGAIAFSDAQLGRVLDALAATGALDRTLVVITSDHGEEFYEHQNWRHGNQLYNEVVHVPLLFRLPGRLPAERRQDVSMLVDVLPTIVDLVGSNGPIAGLDGRALFASAPDTAPTAFSEHFWLEGGRYVSRMVERGNLKLKETRDETRSKERTELYDLASDDREQRNLLENRGHVSENGVGELQDLLARFGDKVSVESAVAVEVDPSTQERLRALGY